LAATRACSCVGCRCSILPGLTRPYCLAPHIDLARQDGCEFIGETFQPRPLAGGFTIEFVIENDRGDGCQKAERGSKQRLGDARRHDGKIGVLADRNRLEARHDAPYRAKQPDERRGRSNCGEEGEPALKPLDLAADGHVHDLLDSELRARCRLRIALDAPLPFTHGGDEQGGHAGVPPLTERLIQLLERLSRPEHLLEIVGLFACLGEQEELLKDDRPTPYRRSEQPDHHDFDDDVSVAKQLPDRQIDGDIRRGHDSLVAQLQSVFRGHFARSKRRLPGGPEGPRAFDQYRRRERRLLERGATLLARMRLNLGLLTLNRGVGPRAQGPQFRRLENYPYARWLTNRSSAPRVSAPIRSGLPEAETRTTVTLARASTASPLRTSWVSTSDAPPIWLQRVTTSRTSSTCAGFR